MSKSAKKNKKKLQKKAAARSQEAKAAVIRVQDERITIRDQLQEQLDLAKQQQDHARMNKLREQIWIVNDLIAGIRTNMPEKEMQEILSSLPLPEKEVEAAPVSATATLSEPEKRLRNLKKKITQIEKIKEKKEKGETLEKTQLEKLATEDSIQEEIDELEEAIEKAFSLRG